LEILDKALSTNKLLKSYIIQEIINLISIMATDLNPTNIQMSKLVLSIIKRIIDYITDSVQIQVIKNIIWKIFLSFYDDIEIKHTAFDIVCSNMVIPNEISQLLQNFII